MQCSFLLRIVSFNFFSWYVRPYPLPYSLKCLFSSHHMAVPQQSSFQYLFWFLHYHSFSYFPISHLIQFQYPTHLRKFNFCCVIKPFLPIFLHWPCFSSIHHCCFYYLILYSTLKPTWILLLYSIYNTFLQLFNQNCILRYIQSNFKCQPPSNQGT